MNTARESMHLYELTLQAFEGHISPEDFSVLQSYLKDPVNREKYAETAFLFTRLKNAGHLFKSETVLDATVWQALSEYERTAQRIEIKEPHQPVEPDQVAAVPVKRRISRYSTITTILSLAAVLLMFVYIRFLPPHATSVATIIDSVNAKWADSDVSTSADTRLWGNQTLQLLKGAVRIQFDYGAEIIVEAPAEIELESPENMTIHYGRLFAHVPEQATGFTVDTPTSKIIDIGTEFGVEVGYIGDTDVHMFKGNASLVAGCASEKKSGMQLTAGNAKAVLQTGQVIDIHLKNHAFVRKIDSSINLLWRGESLDLADVVGGGDGFGTGVLNHGVDVISGQQCQEVQTDQATGGVNQYVTVPDSNLIDGVFVVNNQEEAVLIDANGHVFDPGYATEGLYWGYIVNGAFHEGNNVRRHTLMLDDQPCGTKDNPAIGIHSNMGITFDLNEIRKRLPGITIDRFTASAGISETVAAVLGTHTGKADFWVLLDGNVRFSKRVHWQDGSCDIEFSVQPNDRFLTLIVTDAGDRDQVAYDWAMFVNPVLELR